MLHEDKRRFFRMMVNAEARVMVLEEGNSQAFDAVCRDLSATGMSLEMEEPLEVNTLVKVSLASANQAVPPLDAVAKVIRCTAQETQGYLTGVEIVELN